MTNLRLFKIAGHLEAISYLLLLGVAMPLKYHWDMPIFVRIMGSCHGLFFISYCVALAKVTKEHNWPHQTTGLAFLSAFLPFGPFVFEAKGMPQPSAEGA